MLLTQAFSTYTAQANQQERLTSIIQMIGGSLLIALCSQIALPFTLVPVTLQTFAILFLAGLFGRKKATWMVMAYFGQILIGLPVLAGGIANPLAFAGLKGGYILGFYLEAFVMGWIKDNTSPIKSSNLVTGGIVAVLLQLGLGACWLSYFVGWKTAFAIGFYPFILIEAAKVLMAAWAVRKYS